jgi:glyceraldehyde-3-phosphate dehydrogenase/erythrose-4-phosphate dehydrogenase
VEDLEVDVVIESTGFRRSRQSQGPYCSGWGKKELIISAILKMKKEWGIMIRPTPVISPLSL